MTTIVAGKLDVLLHMLTAIKDVKNASYQDILSLSAKNNQTVLTWAIENNHTVLIEVSTYT